MKNIKEHKGQILAALALSFALGLAMAPKATFATDVAPEEVGMLPVGATEVADEGEATGEAGTNEESVTPLNVETTEDETAGEGTDETTEGDVAGQAEGTGTGDGANEGEEAISQDVAVNLSELDQRVQTRESFADYRKAAPMVRNANFLDLMLKKVENVAQISPELDWESFPEEEQEALIGKTMFEAVNYIKGLPIYGTDAKVKKLVDDILAGVTTAQTSLKAQIKELMPATPGVDDMDMEQLVATAKTYTGYAKYLKLAEAMTALDTERGKLTAGTAMTEANVKAAYKNDEGQMMIGYNAIALAALEIDDTVMEGLMSYELPQTGAGTEDKPTTPDTGVVGTAEANALDLTLVLTVVAGSLALLGGAGLIAKLYLCRKF